MSHSTSTGACMAPIEIKKLPLRKCKGYEEPKLTEHLTSFNGLGSNKPCDFRGPK